jgi:preprotein translocase subunit SecD
MRSTRVAAAALLLSSICANAALAQERPSAPAAPRAESASTHRAGVAPTRFAMRLLKGPIDIVSAPTSASEAARAPGWFEVRQANRLVWQADPVVLVDESRIAHAEATWAPSAMPGSSPEPGLRLTLTARGRALVAAATAAHVGDGLGMFVDDRLVLAAIIRGPLGGAFELSLPG